MANPGQAISFDSNSLQTANILTADIDINSAPDINAQIYEIAHANANSIPFVSWPKRVIPLTGTLEHTSISNLDTLIDTFKSYLTKQNGNLDVGWAGGTRRFVGTFTKPPKIVRPQNLLFAQYDAEITCQPFGQDITATSLVSATGLTVASRTDTPTFGGTAPYQYPVITITFNSIGGSPVSGTVSVGNNSNGQQVNITRTWSDGDVLVIDMTQLLNTLGVSQPVTVNGEAVDYTGALPEFPPGAASISYTDDFSSRNFDYAIDNTNRYL